ncbi:hypothetical protein ABL78_3950 [Leptomonas seymouri]|uniref:A-kinase anchor protein 7-like phosphoesterase domain-containing protein n=1 Tax=Leptomonas seymouri TaxID=5684 RepID=A0A0N0P5X3_LEPSE|nr:hypothetical protein ABL78_3950 [Leptomonas seymouri]|eukprot:KPI86959.1 hypothetical protein ABL78_3950 [Leptomonas seymouri]
MAHLIAPPCSVQPMTKEDVAVVQAEKRVDAATREQLIKVYGDSRDPHGRPIDLTRPPRRNWTCPACGKTSTDIRHVCGYCLQPEPGYTNQRLICSKSGTAEDGAQSTAAEEVLHADVRRAGTSRDAGVQLLQIPSTERTYRLFSEPHVPTAASHFKPAAVRGDTGVREGVEGEDRAWGDEPNCPEERSCGPHGAAVAADAELRPPNEEKGDGAFTHFVSIPLGKLPAITVNATRVLEDLRSFLGADAHPNHEEEETEDGLSESTASSTFHLKSSATPDLVTSTPKLHMTLLMLTLPTREDVEFAKELLQGPFAAAWAAVKEKAVAGRDSSNAPSLLLSGDTSIAPAHRHPLIRLGGGLQVMKAGRDNQLYQPHKASVVYMGIDDPAALATVQQLQRVLHESFAELIQDRGDAERSRRVLHATIMNKKWRKAHGARRPFDARPILEAFQKACISAGDDGRQLFEIPELELCSRQRYDAETGTYAAEAAVRI